MEDQYQEEDHRDRQEEDHPGQQEEDHLDNHQEDHFSNKVPASTCPELTGASEGRVGQYNQHALREMAQIGCLMTGASIGSSRVAVTLPESCRSL